jgi:hypothetical protein
VKFRFASLFPATGSVWLAEAVTVSTPLVPDTRMNVTSLWSRVKVPSEQLPFEQRGSVTEMVSPVAW